MKARFLQLAGLCFVLSIMLLLGACHKKSAPVAPPQAPPPAAKPSATLTASPTTVQRGGSVRLEWNTQNATEVSIDPIGTVPLNGTRTLTPAASMTYTLTAKGPGGTVQESARVTVTEPPPAAAAAGPTDEQLFERNMKDIFFNYDKYDVRPSDAPALKADVAFLEAHPGFKVVIAGYCDERGSDEYNLALGSSRANAVRDELVKMGVASNRIKTISYGKEKPFCTEQDEQCWQQNRRAHFSLQ